MRRILAVVAVAAPLLAACSDPGAPELSGQWGGSEANLRLTPGGGSIEYGCGAGTITLTVAITDLPDSIGPLTLERGRIATLHLCL